MNSKKIILFSAILLMSDQLLSVSTRVNGSKLEEYLISTEGCRIPAFPLISNEIKKLMTHKEKRNCSENIHLLDSNSTHIWIVKDSLDLYNVFNANDFYCCYKYFMAVNNIAQIVYGECVEFSDAIKARHEFVRVECFYLDTKMYDDYFLFPSFTTARPEFTRYANHSQPNFNVLLFGIESMSRMNFIRMMPRTYKFLQEKESIQLLGYNKVGENSLPNLFPFLFGKSYEQTKNSCIRDDVIDSSECVFIWTIFKAAGYSTFLASDSVAGLLGNHEYSLPTIPTDFYLQPFIFETRNLFKNKHYSFHQCFQNKYYYKLLLNWSAQLLKNSNSKLFGVFWEESMSHENFNLPESVDEDHFNFLKELENLQGFDDSVVIFFSDHGMRWGKIAQTKQGRVENRLPLFEIMFPKQFKSLYPLAFKNFKENRYRLTSPYDVHKTLLDLALNKLEDYEINEKSIKITHHSKEISLFLPVPEQRTCEIIGIDEHWCTCKQQESVVMDEELKLLAANYLVRHINRLLRRYPRCQQLKLQRILNATLSNGPRSKSYWVIFQTSPGGGIFDGTLHRRGQQFFVSGAISRLNLYRHTSHCIQNTTIKMFCTCKYQ